MMFCKVEFANLGLYGRKPTYIFHEWNGHHKSGCAD